MVVLGVGPHSGVAVLSVPAQLAFLDVLEIQKLRSTLLLIIKLCLGASLLVEEAALALASLAESGGLGCGAG